MLRYRGVLVSSQNKEMDVLLWALLSAVLSPVPGELQSSLSGPINESGSSFVLFLLKRAGGLLHLRADPCALSGLIRPAQNSGLALGRSCSCCDQFYIEPVVFANEI